MYVLYNNLFNIMKSFFSDCHLISKRVTSYFLSVSVHRRPKSVNSYIFNCDITDLGLQRGASNNFRLQHFNYHLHKTI